MNNDLREDSTHKILLVSACVLLKPDGTVLIAKRPEGRPLAGLWEFPGGKVDEGEAPETALLRELSEELGVRVVEDDIEPLTFVSHAYEAFHLLMPVYLCRRWDGEAQALEGQELAWVRPEELSGFDMPPADEPLKTTLRGLLDRL
ncbi:8-oxo-dGTP diphosphatase [Methyloligella halotolerans]|uniref:8-oxo-dGTP diphosphatase n=1 Tax=Methyloligella halotolerans TaxID=1177755 RepID=A0A1E2RYM3_9HYPH|nr:(deoxy)nucleoside triphosphate pyrophosphohydrolase [Methyloligella halotolerans]ODA67337.1 8-oxo-dGTP diphosphatase [Methyloligella halotolerans]